MNKVGLKKECLHNLHSVYYGSEWEVECRNCGENIYDLYDKDVANFIINNLNKLRIVKIYEKYYPQYFEEYRNIFFKKKNKWKNFQRWCEGGNDLIGMPSAYEYVNVKFNTEEDAINYMMNLQKKEDVVWSS